MCIPISVFTLELGREKGGGVGVAQSLPPCLYQVIAALEGGMEKEVRSGTGSDSKRQEEDEEDWGGRGRGG